MRTSGRFGSAPVTVQVRLSAKIADTWKPSLKEIGSVLAGTTVEVLEDMIVVDAPDIVRVTQLWQGWTLRKATPSCAMRDWEKRSSDFWAESFSLQGREYGFGF